MICAQIVECLCRLCCIAEYTPFPYTKWLVRAAGQTRLGERVMPLVDAAQEELRLSPLLPVETLAPQWPPRQKLKAAFDRALAQLAAWGWSDEWIEQPWLAVGVTHLRQAP